MSTRPTTAPVQSRRGRSLHDVLRAGLALNADHEEGPNKRPRSDAGPSGYAPGPPAPVPAPVADAASVQAAERRVYAVKVAIPRNGLLDMNQRSRFGVSTDMRWKRTETNADPASRDRLPYVERPWREVPTVEYTTIPDNYGVETLDRIVADLKQEMMDEHRDRYYAFWTRLSGALQAEESRLPEYRRSIIMKYEGLAAFLGTLNAIKPRGDSGTDRFLPIPAGDEDEKEKTLQMYLAMKQVVSALENGVWSSSGAIPDMARFIRDMQADVDPLAEEEDQAEQAAQGGGQAMDDGFGDVSSDDDDN